VCVACVNIFEKDQDNTLTELAKMRRYKALYEKYKAEAEYWKNCHCIAQEQSTRQFNAMRILTTGRQASLNWLYTLGDLDVRIPENVRMEIGDCIDETYEQWRNECDEGRDSASSPESATDEDCINVNLN